MVCRENKARSAVMGFMKSLMAQHNPGQRLEHDRLFQSTIHQNGHVYAEAPDPTVDEYMAFLQGTRQQIADDPNISHARKFSDSMSQPGMVTRIDQEIERVRTGKDEKGNPLRPEQRNGGKHFAAMQRMNPAIERAVVARDGYLENYARHTGKSVSEARAEWDQLVSRPIDRSDERDRPDLRSPDGIRLTDNWRDSLSSAGMTANQQSDLMQDNASRQALRIMEERRLTKVRSLRGRRALREEHRVPLITSAQAKTMVKCDTCGQFGHEESACPNQSAFDKTLAAANKYHEAKTHADALDERTLASLRARLTDDEPVEAPTEREIKQARQQVLLTERAWQKEREAFEKQRGPVPIVTDAVKDLSYNRETGALAVTRFGYTRKTDGVEMPPKTYLYRMSNEEFDQAVASDSLGRAIGVTTGGKGDINAAYAFENPQDADEANIERRCPTCGQWASMNSSHQCPMGGSRSQRAEEHYRERQRVGREQSANEGMPLIADSRRAGKQHPVNRSTTAQMSDGTQVTFGLPSDVMAARQNGKIAQSPVVGRNVGYTVTGRSHSWKDPRTGQPYTTFTDMTCTCGERGTCEHRERVANTTAVGYRSQRVKNARPGQWVSSNVDSGTRSDVATAQDAPPVGGLARVNYAVIQKRRREQAERLNEQWSRGRNEYGPFSADRTVSSHATTSYGGGTMNAAPPPAYTVGGEQPRRYDMTRNTQEASQYMASQLQERSGGREWVVRDNGNGTQTITAPDDRLERDGSLSLSDQRALAGLLGTSGGRGTRYGAFIPNDPAWRSEFMDRAGGREPEVRGGRIIATSERSIFNPDTSQTPRRPDAQ